MGAVKEIKSVEEYDALVKSTNKKVVVDFYADWCGPCKALKPTFEKMAEEYAGKIEFASVNVDDLDEVADNENIQSLPTIQLFNKGERGVKICGAQVTDIQNAIAKLGAN